MSAQLDFQPSPSLALTRRAWLLALAVALGACLIRILLAGQRGLEPDELLTLHAARLSLHDLVRDRLAAGDSPLYYLYARLGLAVGAGERALRLASALAAGAAALLLTGLMGELRLGRALPALWFLALAAPGWLHAGTASQPAMMLIALAAGTAWAAARHAASPTAGRGAVLALAALGLLATHAATLPLVAALLAFQLWDGLYTGVGHSREQRLGQALRQAAPLLAALALGALLCLARRHPATAPAEAASAAALFPGLVDGLFGDHRLWFNFLNWPHHAWFFNLEAAVLLAAVWLARRELLRLRNQRAWRLLACSLIAAPLLFLLGPARGLGLQKLAPALAALSIPAAVCLALAAHSSAASRWVRALYGTALILVLACQVSAEALDRGDRQRDAVEWLKRVHQGKEPVLLAGAAMNDLTLAFYGFTPAGRTFATVAPGNSTNTAAMRIKEAMLTRFAGSGRLYYVRQRSKAHLPEACDSLVQQGFFAAHRKWRIAGSQLIVGAAVRSRADLAWLQALPPPARDWTPAQAGR